MESAPYLYVRPRLFKGRINHFPVDSAISLPQQRYPKFEQPGPDRKTVLLYVTYAFIS